MFRSDRATLFNTMGVSSPLMLLLAKISIPTPANVLSALVRRPCPILLEEVSSSSK